MREKLAGCYCIDEYEGKKRIGRGWAVIQETVEKRTVERDQFRGHLGSILTSFWWLEGGEKGRTGVQVVDMLRWQHRAGNFEMQGGRLDIYVLEQRRKYRLDIEIGRSPA